MPATKLTEYLDEHNVIYEVIKHPLTYTAQETAASADIPGRQLAKTVMVKIDKRMTMAVLPAPERVSFDRLKAHTNAEKVTLASEEEFRSMFPDCELGAMPPFGNLYGMQVIAADTLAEEMEIAFCAGSHTELVRIAFKDFQRLAEPDIFAFTWAE